MMLSSINLRMAMYIAAVAVIFFAGFRTSSHLWSARYERLEAQHWQRIVEQRQRLLAKQEALNSETQRRERELLRELHAIRGDYEQLANNIARAPVVRAGKRTEKAPACNCGPVIDWAVFGGLYDSAAIAGPTAAGSIAGGSDAAGAPVTTAR